MPLARVAAVFWLVVGLVVVIASLTGCAATPPMPLENYILLRDAARDHLSDVEILACPSPDSKRLCDSTRLLREQLKPADATMIQGYAKGGLSEEQWAQALGIVTGVLGKALSSFLGIPGR